MPSSAPRKCEVEAGTIGPTAIACVVVVATIPTGSKSATGS